MKKPVILIYLLLASIMFIACDNSVDNQGGRAPIYQGMTISNSSTLQNTTFQNTILTSYSSKTNQILGIESEIDDQFDVHGESELEYFAYKNQNVYITVRLINPDSQVILRFTLNGLVYQSYQFQSGSDSENLILEVNSGDISGIKEFTIDEIKYIDNETNETKDAIFEGDRVVKLGVTYDVFPQVNVTNYSINATSIIYEFDISDEIGLAEQAGNPIKAFLYDGDSIIKSIDLSLGFNQVQFDNLMFDKEFEFVIAAMFDVLDGLGQKVSILYQTTFQTEKIIQILDSNVEQTKISFDLDNKDFDQVGSITSIELYQGETLIETLADLSLREFTELLSNNEYTIKVTYTYDLNDGAGQQILVTSKTWSTQSKLAPEVSIYDVSATHDSLSFDIDVTDFDQVGSITSIELYQGETLVETLTDLTVREFTGLLSNNDYTINVTYTYDLNDGAGQQIMVTSKTWTTQSKLAPEVSIDDVSATQDSLTFDIDVTDPDQVGGITNIELYQGETLIKTLTDLTVIEFTGLLSNNDYTINVTYTYDLNDGAGQQIMVTSKTWTTQSKLAPEVSIDDVSATQDSLTFDIDVTDPDQVGGITNIELYQGETLIKTLTDLTVIEFTGLLSNNEYTIKVTYIYDLNDGAGQQILVTSKIWTTQQKTVPTLDVEYVAFSQTIIDMDINIIDFDNTGAITSIELYQGDNLIQGLIDFSQYQFYGNFQGNGYYIKAIYSYDLSDGKGLHSITSFYGLDTLINMVNVGDKGIVYSVPMGIDNDTYVQTNGGFLLATTATTYELWYSVRLWAENNNYTFQNLGQEGYNGLQGGVPTANKQQPVIGVSWRDSVVWLNALSEMNGLDPAYRTAEGQVIRSSLDENASVIDSAYLYQGNGYRLPTQYEWEMSAKWIDGMTWNSGKNPSGSSELSTNIDESLKYAWFHSSSGGITHDVGLLLPNHLGLYDMSGNVWEWTDGKYGLNRITYGGHFNNDWLYIQTGFNMNYASSTNSPYWVIGFRIARDIK